MFVYWAFEDQGSGLLIQSYTNAAREMGHDIVVYGRPTARIPLNYSMDVDSADALVFIFEWTTHLWHGDNLDFVRLMKVPRRRRVVIDGDGNYNELIQLDGDYNHRDEECRKKWLVACDQLSDKICQPTLHPKPSNARTFLFYCYNPAWELPLDVRHKEYGLLYIGNSKFRWPGMSKVLAAVEPVRSSIGRIGLVGHGWETLPQWARPMKLESAYYTDVHRLQRLGVEFLSPVPFSQVVRWMNKALINPVLTRPTFNYLQYVTPRYFETPAAGTIPLFVLDSDHVRDIYGDVARELLLPFEAAEEKILDIVNRPRHYAEVVEQIRSDLRHVHSQKRRVQELIDIIES